MAGNSEKIDEIVDTGAVYSQLDGTLAKVEALEAALVDTAKGAAALNAELAKSGNFRTVATGANQAANATLKLQQEAEKLAQQLQKTQQELLKTQQQQARLTGENAKAQQAVDRLTSAQAKAAQQAAKNSTEYQKLVQAYNAATAAAREAGVVHGVQSEQFAREAENVRQLRTQLDSIDQPLGNFQRNVGNYANSIGSLFTRVYGYIRTAANIIPGLGISGIFLAAFEGLKFLYDKIKGVGDQLDTLSEKFKQAREAANENAAQEITKLDSLYDAATNLNIPFNERIRAVKELQKEYPAYFGNLSQEEILVGKAKSAYDALSDSIINQAVVKASQERITEALKPLIDTIAEQKRLQAELDKNNAAAQAKNPNRTVSFGTVNGNGANVPGFRQPVSTGARPVVFDQSFIDDQTEAAKKAGTSGLQDINTYKKRIIDAVKDARDSVQSILQDFGINSLLDPNAKEKKGTKPKNTALQTLNDQLEQAKNIRDRLLADENSNYDDRLQALTTYERDTENLILAAEAKKTITSLDAGNRAAKIEQDSDKIRIDIAKKAQDEILKSFKEGAKQQEEILKNSLDVAEQYANQRKSQIQAYADDALVALSQQYAKGLIKTDEYNKQKADIEGQARLDQDQNDIDRIKIRLGIEMALGEDQAKDLQALEDAKRNQAKDTADIQISEAQRAAAEKKKLSDAEKQLGEAVGEFAKTLIDARYTRELNAIQDQKDAITDKAKTDIDAENRSFDNTATKADKISVINAQAQAQQEALDAKARKIKQQQAETDRLFAIAKVIENTAIAVTAALPNIPLSIIVGALGAVQIATILATPIPKYHDGVESHPGGKAIVGDGGTELLVYPGGKMQLTPSSDTLMNLPKGTQVIPHMQLMGALSAGKLNHAAGEQVPWREIIKAINGSKQPQKRPVFNGWLNETSRANNFDRYRNNHFR